MGIDNDPDAVLAAHMNLAVNPGVDAVIFEEADLRSWLPGRRSGRFVRLAASEKSIRPLIPPADVVTANLTGALLVREAASLAGAMAAGGSLVVSGLLAAERIEVVAEFERAAHSVLLGIAGGGWVGLL